MSKPLFTWLILTSLFFIYGERAVFAQTIPNTRTIEAQVTISASLGEPILKLWGYGLPDSKIELSGNAVYDTTYSRSDGYYEFTKAYLPNPTNFFYPELCLIQIDGAGRATPPTCIPPLPANSLSYDIGPIILPPTLSLEAGSVTVNEQVAASGITIPNSEVNIVIAEGENTNSLTGFSLVKEAKAYYIPDYTVKSDERGYFSFNMPSVNSDTWRVFAITRYSQSATSPKSNTLTFEVVSPVLVAIGNLWKFILSLLNLPILIFLEILTILILVTLLLTKKRKRKISPTTTNAVNEYQKYLMSRRRADF
jgi:hypothetical protein